MEGEHRYGGTSTSYPTENCETCGEEPGGKDEESWIYKVLGKSTGGNADSDQGFKIVKAGTMGEMVERDPTVEYYEHRRPAGIDAIRGAKQVTSPN